MYTLYRQMKLILRHYRIETTEIPDVHVGHSGSLPPHGGDSKGLGMGPSMEAPPTASVFLSHHSWQGFIQWGGGGGGGGGGGASPPENLTLIYLITKH